MNLILVDKDELQLGQPLPWTLYSQEGAVLVEAGQTIESEEQLQSLLEQQAGRKSMDEEPTADVPVSGEPPEEGRMPPVEGTQFTFADIRLRVGDRIQLQPPVTVGLERYMVRLIGYMENASLLVSAPVASNGVRAPMREGDKVVARVFSSEKAFAFDCSVVRVCHLPYHYLHLSFPDVIQGAVIRKSPRIRTHIIASIGVGQTDTGSEKQSGIIVNLSIDGALIKTRQALYEKGQEVHLSFRITLHNIDAYISAKAVVRNAYVENGKGMDDPLKFHHGIQFLDLPANDRLILQSLIYQQMIEQPQSIT